MVVYSALLLLALLLSSPWWLWRMASNGRYRAGLSGRLGRLPSRLDEIVRQRESHPGLVWIHAVSVGEVLAAERLVRELQQALPNWQIIASTTTQTGQRIAADQLGVPTFYFPLDFAFAVRRYLRALRPTLFLTLESELWPRMIVECAAAGVAVAVVNARISDRSLPRYRRLRRLWAPLLRQVALFCAQGQESADRLIRIGAPADRVVITGNLKYDAAPAADNLVAERIAELLQQHPLLVAGSTLAGEEAMLLALWPGLLERVASAVLLIAPRHPQRFDEVFGIIRNSGYPVLRCQQLSGSSPPVLPGTILLLDTLGDLAAVYALATAAFVGGSLVGKGGHNPVEATRFGVPVIMGPSYENFREMVESMIAEGAVRIVEPPQLREALIDALEQPVTGRGAYTGESGATTRTVAALVGLLQSNAARPA